MPLVTITTSGNAKEPYDIRVGGEGEIYTVTTGKVVTQFVPKEHLAAFITAVAAADASATVTSAPE